MVSAVLGLVLIALTATLLALVLPWLRREGGYPMEWERKTLFALLLLDAALTWLFVGYAGAPLGAGVLLSAALAAAGNLGLGLYLALRGFALPTSLRWTAAALLGVIEPLFLLVGLALLRSAASA